MLWRVDFDNADARAAMGGDGMDPFYAMLAGGQGGTLHEEMIDYFYLAQLKAQGLASTVERDITGHVPFEHTGSLLRAAGYYPSEAEVACIVDELKHENHYETGELVADLTFDSLLKVFVNHRPVVGVSPEDIEDAFEALGSQQGTKLISHERLLGLLAARGELSAHDTSHTQTPSQGHRVFLLRSVSSSIGGVAESLCVNNVPGESLTGRELSTALEELLGPGMDLTSLGSSDITPIEMAEGVSALLRPR